MDIIEIIKIVVLGIVEGISEWLPISSTGHMLLVDEFIQLNFTEEFKNMFFVVIQFGAILAVILVFWKKIFPFSIGKGGIKWEQSIFIMWTKVFVACLPSAVGLFIDDFLEENFGTPLTIATMLIVYGVAFILIENGNNKKAKRLKKIESVDDITYKLAVIIGIFQVLAMIPGTSRSGATIVGALIMGVSRVAASEFTFFLAIPTMFAASGYKLLKFGLDFTSDELFALGLGMIVAFVVSIFAIKFLMSYIKKHDFKAFGWYRIVLGIIIIAYFVITSMI
ncbi:MAG: undecaprenyl-diphosphate phosphatase [Clostridia bacterium]